MAKMVKVTIPHELQIEILRIQVEENLSWEDACIKAATLLKTNSEEFKRAVEAEAERRYKSRHMSELDKARKTIEEKAYKKGYDEGYRKGYDEGYTKAMSEDHFYVPCSICGKPMHFSSKDSNWKDVKRVLYNAFRTWAHTACLEKRK